MPQRLADTQVFQEDLTGFSTKQSFKTTFGLPPNRFVGTSGKTDFKGLAQQPQGAAVSKPHWYNYLGHRPTQLLSYSRRTIILEEE